MFTTASAALFDSSLVRSYTVRVTVVLWNVPNKEILQPVALEELMKVH